MKSPDAVTPSIYGFSVGNAAGRGKLLSAISRLTPILSAFAFAIAAVSASLSRSILYCGFTLGHFDGIERLLPGESLYFQCGQSPKLFPIAVFRHYCSRHLICIVPFTRRGPSLHGRCPASPLLWPHPTPRFAFAIARPPKFLTELSRRVVLLCPAAPARPKPIRTHGVGFTASELLAARNSSNETLRRRFICIATHLFVRQDSRSRVAPLTACHPNHISVCL